MKKELECFSRQLGKDLSNLMECLKKQDEDNKPILYLGKQLKKVILPYDEYRKIKVLESVAIDKDSGLKYNTWLPIELYYKNADKLDWALVQFKETRTGYMPLPKIAEYKKRDKVWATYTEVDRYLCEMCEPVAFMLWQPCDKGVIK